MADVTSQRGPGFTHLVQPAQLNGAGNHPRSHNRSGWNSQTQTFTVTCKERLTCVSRVFI